MTSLADDVLFAADKAIVGPVFSDAGMYWAIFVNNQKVYLKDLKVVCSRRFEAGPRCHLLFESSQKLLSILIFNLPIFFFFLLSH